MEAVVVLTKSVEKGKPLPNRKKRRFNKKKSFIRPKLWYRKKNSIPNEPKGNFKGFVEVSGNDFTGFTEAEILHSTIELNNSHLVGVNHLESKTIVSSVGLMKSGNYEHNLVVLPVKKRSIRVLSLFDGISTALYILENKLNLSVEAYFSSEIEEHALKLQSDRWSGKIVQIGDVKSIKEELLLSLGRIDLLIGGSPCDELSRVNWRGRGLHDQESSGHLFFNFVTIRDSLNQIMASSGHPLFWLFENTAYMKPKLVEDMSRALGSKPMTVCASSFVPMRRRRNFWGNIPGMNDICTSTEQATSLELQDFLRPNRTANFSTAKTLTTNRSNEKKGDKMPVTMNGEAVSLNVNEIESLMGFPIHYTDGCDLSVTQRLKLLGKGWCVPVVAKILEPLTELYVLK